MRPPLDMKMYFPGSNEEVPPQLSIPDNEIVEPRLCLSAVSSSLQSVLGRLQSDNSLQSRLKTATSQPSQRLVSARVRAAQNRLQPLFMLYQQLSRQSITSASSVSVTSVPLLVSRVADGNPQRSFLLPSQLVLPLKCRMHELQKLFTRQLRQSTAVVQRVKNIPWSLSKRSETLQSRVSLVGSLRSSFHKDRRIQPVLLHRRLRCPDAGLVLALHAMLFSVLIRPAAPNEFSENHDFFD